MNVEKDFFFLEMLGMHLLKLFLKQNRMGRSESPVT